MGARQDGVVGRPLAHRGHGTGRARRLRPRPLGDFAVPGRRRIAQRSQAVRSEATDEGGPWVTRWCRSSIDVAEAELDDLRDRLRRTRWPEAETVDDWSQGIPLAYVQELCAYWADGYDWRRARGAPQRASPVPHRDRRARHPLPPRPLAPRRRAAAGHHPRLAGLDRRVPQGHRAAHRPDRPRRRRRPTRSTSSCPSLPGFGFSDKPDRARLGRRAHRRRVGDADGAPRLRPLRRPGRRLGLGGHRPHRRCSDPDHCVGIHLNMADRGPGAPTTWPT